MPKQINMELKTIGILVSILMAIGGVIWFFAKQSSHIDHIRGTLNEVRNKITDIDGQLSGVEGAVIRVEAGFDYMKADLNYMKKEQRAADEAILRELEEINK